MRQARADLCALFLLVSVISSPGQRRTPNLFSDFDSSSFQKYPLAQQPLDLKRLDTNRLSVAVFHETNRRRKDAGLSSLAYDDRTRRAAAIQASLMAQRRAVSHENPGRTGLQTLQDRLRTVGLKPRFAAENVATEFGLQYESGQRYYERTEDGKTVLSYTPNGKPIRTHTYLSFATSLVDHWMNSPGHRKNILHPAPKFLGTSCVPAREKNAAMPTFYCAQVFYTPL